MRVVHHDLVRPGGHGPVDRGIDLVEHEVAATRVRRRVVGHALGPVDDASDTFHVAGNPDLHAFLLLGPRP